MKTQKNNIIKIFALVVFSSSLLCSLFAMEEGNERKVTLDVIYLLKTPPEEGASQKPVAVLKLADRNFVLDKEDKDGKSSVALFPENFDDVNWLKFLGRERDEMLIKEAKAEALLANKAHIETEAIKNYELNNLSRVQRHPVIAALAFTALGACSYATINTLFSRK